MISAVYHNRLKKGMLLQADPAVQYALGHHVARVMFKDLEIDSRYNTYKYKGLPPGPIASPTPLSNAAAHPADVPYLYFVAAATEHHEFRKTFAEHAEAIAEKIGGLSAHGSARPRRARARHCVPAPCRPDRGPDANDVPDRERDGERSRAMAKWSSVDLSERHSVGARRHRRRGARGRQADSAPGRRPLEPTSEISLRLLDRDPNASRWRMVETPAATRLERRTVYGQLRRPIGGYGEGDGFPRWSAIVLTAGWWCS
ncbi:MAG: endolytic transglycosylase MltG [Gemmatimonadaceae bacterium]